MTYRMLTQSCCPLMTCNLMRPVKFFLHTLITMFSGRAMFLTPDECLILGCHNHYLAIKGSTIYFTNSKLSNRNLRLGIYKLYLAVITIFQ